MSSRSNRTLALQCSGGPELSISPVDGAHAVSVRYLTVRDEGSDSREAFVRAVFGDLACFPFFDEGTFPLSRAETDYDILILDAADPARMARYLRINRAMLRNVAMFAIMQDSSPPRRARMLVAGCDDVFDCARISKEEAALRVDAVMRRYKAREATRQEGRRFAADVAHIAAPHLLTPRECALLKALTTQSGKAISAQQLCRFVAPQDPAPFKRSLKFAISRLRGKLYPHWRIKCVADTGYALVRVDVGLPEVTVAAEVGSQGPSRQPRDQQEAFKSVRSAA